MNLPKDPFMLYGMINMKLRDEGLSLEEFCSREDVNINEIKDKLAAAGFSYDSALRQFR